jgi:hypothetical protein
VPPAMNLRRRGGIPDSTFGDILARSDRLLRA